jgi:hypothetical protein
VGQLVLAIVAALYAASFFWLRRLAKFDPPERLLDAPAPGVPAVAPEAVAAWQGSTS